MDLDMELRKLLLEEVTSDDVLRREIVRKVIYKEADLLAVGTKVADVQNFTDLDVKFHFPEKIEGEYPVPPYARAELAPPLSWVEWTMTLKRAEVRYFIGYEADARGLERYQREFTRRRASEALAFMKDKNILDAILAGAGYTKTLAAGSEWNATGGKPEDDITEAIGWIFDNSNILETDIKRLAVLVPTKVWAVLLKLQSIKNIIQSLKDYFEASYGITFYPTRYYTDDAIVMIPSPMTCIHGVYTGKEIPLVFEDRTKRGVEYTIAQYFNTVVVPESKTQTTSNRIYRIKNVVA